MLLYERGLRNGDKKTLKVSRKPLGSLPGDCARARGARLRSAIAHAHKATIQGALAPNSASFLYPWMIRQPRKLPAQIRPFIQSQCLRAARGSNLGAFEHGGDDLGFES